MNLLRLALLALVAAPALAAVPATWTKEPTTVFGIALGKPFPSPSEVADCPVFAPFRREPQSEELCVDTREGFSADLIPVRNVPLADIATTAKVHLHAGLVRSIVATIDRKRYDAAKDILIERYGAPHARELAELPGSNTHASEVLTWTGARTAISLRQRAEAADGKDVEVASLEFKVVD